MAVEAGRTLLRAAAPGDLVAASALLSGAKLPTDGFADRFGEGYVVAEQHGRLIGMAGIEVYGRFGLLRSVVVDSARRGTGVGVRLAEDRIAWAKRRQLSAIYLLTTTAAPFFAKLGFTEVPRSSAPAEIQASSEFSVVCPSSATCMRLAHRR